MGELWTANISRGGLFVATEDPPPSGTQVVVSLDTPVGVLTLRADVVHVVDRVLAAQTGQAAGAGLHFSALSDEQRTQVEAYIGGLEAQFGASGGAPPPASNLPEVLACARVVVKGVDDEDLYAAAGLEPDAGETRVKSRVEELQALFAQVPADATPPQATRIQTAARASARLQVLLDPEKREFYRDRRQRLAGGPSPRPAPAQRSETPPPAGPAVKDVATVRQRMQASSAAREAAETALALLERQRFSDAEARFAEAMSLEPNVVAYKVEHAWAMALNPERPERERRAKAMESLKALASEGKSAQAFFRLAMLFRLVGDDKNALIAAQKAVLLDKNHVQAASMVRLLEKRAFAPAAPRAPTGVFSKIIGR
jgi:tetratricopeptide (TPR) repeat protein